MAMAVNTYRVVKSIDVLKHQLVRLPVILNFKSVQPFPFDQGMEGFDTGIIPWIAFLGIAAAHLGCFLNVCLRNVLTATVRMDDQQLVRLPFIVQKYCTRQLQNQYATLQPIPLPWLLFFWCIMPPFLFAYGYRFFSSIGMVSVCVSGSVSFCVPVWYARRDTNQMWNQSSNNPHKNLLKRCSSLLFLARV